MFSGLIKKASIIIIGALFLGGCSSYESDFALKEKCAAYIGGAKERVKGNTNLPFYIENHTGTFYSRTKNTCVSTVMAVYQDHTEYKYYDELNGHYFSPDFSKYSIVDANGTLLSIDYLSYEEDLNFVK